MCKYNIAIDDAVMEEVRPAIAEGMDEDVWVQLQVEMVVLTDGSITQEFILR